MGLLFRSATVAAAIWLGSSAAAFAEARLALVIGQSAYRAVTPLPNPANDAKAMASMLSDAGFEVQSASDLTQNDLRSAVSQFAASVVARGPDTTALVFYAGHGVQIDGENYLMPVDIDPKREIDVTLQAVRLNDVLNTLTAVPSKSRIILLDACRNNPFPALKTTPRGLAHVDVKFGAPGTLLSFSTSPGAEAEDGSGGNSPYVTALLKAGREPGIPIEDAFKRVRLAVNQATEGRQTPWESSSLVSDFRLFDARSSEDPKPSVTRRSAEDWKTELKGKPIQAAHDLVVFDGSVEAYEAFVSLFAAPPFGPEAKDWLDRHYRMVAWNIAVITNTVASYEAFLAKYPDSDLTATARRMIERVRNKPVPAANALALASPAGGAALFCPCSAPPASKKAEKPAKAEATKKRAERTRPRREVIEEEEVVVRRPPAAYYAPEPRFYGGIGGGYSRGGYGGSGGYGRGR